MMSMCAHMSAYMSTSEYVFVCICVPASGGRVDIPVFLHLLPKVPPFSNLG